MHCEILRGWSTTENEPKRRRNRENDEEEGESEIGEKQKGCPVPGTEGKEKDAVQKGL